MEKTSINKVYIPDSDLLKAGVIAGIWASFEIIFGAFFHSLRLPFAGTTLSFFSIVLLTAFSRHWKGKFLFLRAAFMTAIMRSVMPLSIILGPFIGIVIEGFLFQFFYHLWGRKRITYYTAGILIMFSALIHKLVSLLIIYGWDLVKIAENLFFVLQKSSHLQLEPQMLFWVVAGFYIITGVAAAELGIWISGVSSRVKEKGGISHIEQTGQSIFDYSAGEKNHYFPLLIPFWVILAVALMFLIQTDDWRYFISVPVYLGVLYYLYPGRMKKLTKLFFWLQLVIIALLTFLLTEDIREGLYLGGRLVSRALIIVGSLTAISVELRNPVVRKMVEKKGMSGLLQTLEAVSGIMPFLLQKLGKNKSKWIHPVELMKSTLALSDELLAFLIRADYEILLITGKVGECKTTALRKFMQYIDSKQLNGVILHSSYGDDGIEKYELEEIQSGKKRLFASVHPMENALKTHRLYISQEAMKAGNAFLIQNIEKVPYIVLDELGPLELRDTGWHEFLSLWIKQNSKSRIIATVREHLAEEIVRKYFPDKKTGIIYCRELLE